VLIVGRKAWAETDKAERDDEEEFESGFRGHSRDDR
jgi:hypothetical protein